MLGKCSKPLLRVKLVENPLSDDDAIALNDDALLPLLLALLSLPIEFDPLLLLSRRIKACDDAESLKLAESLNSNGLLAAFNG